jgi:hypothetical protein
MRIAMPTKIDYDLNIFQYELEVGLDADSFPIYDYAGPWHIDIYEVEGHGHQQIGQLIKLTDKEAKDLQLGDGYFDYPDSWYGMEGFVKDFEPVLSERLLSLFNSLPVYKEEVLF